MTEKLTVIMGPMFAGKSTVLIGRAETAQVAQLKPVVFKPVIDVRYERDKVCAHNGRAIESVVVDDPVQIFQRVKEDKGIKVVLVDEVQFMTKNIIQVVDVITRQLKREVVVAGLNLDFRGEPFGSMPDLVVRANEVVSLSAVCTQPVRGEKICRRSAYFTQRFVDGQPANYNDLIVMVGASESYTARCGTHHKVPGRPRVSL